MGSFSLDHRSHRLLTAAEEVELGRRIRHGDTKALHWLVEGNRRLVISIAARYASDRLPLEDLIQEGCLGLLHAAQKFDERKGCRFSTYATWWIRQAVVRAVVGQTRSIRLPLEAYTLLRRIDGWREVFTREQGRLPTLSEIAEALEVPEARVAELVMAPTEPLSLDLPLSEEGGRLEDVVVDTVGERPMEAVEKFALREEIEQALLCLTERERKVVVRRYGLDGEPGGSLEEVAAGVRLTRERVRQIEVGALRKLRMHLLSLETSEKDEDPCRKRSA